MPSSRYHRKQAELLAGLALSTGDSTKAEQFKLAALEQLDRAQAVKDTGASPSDAKDPDDMRGPPISKWPERSPGHLRQLR
jgi:hypothetical protein